MNRFIVTNIFLLLFSLTLAQVQDTIQQQNIPKTDTSQRPKPLTQVIDYQAKDSIRFFLTDKKTILYSEVELVSKKMNLKAGKVLVDLQNSEIEAFTVKDSTGKPKRPVFNDGNDEFIAYYLKYNFKTRKGFARNVKTQQTEGYLHGDRVKLFPSGVTNIKVGKFTTCDLDHPHYYIRLSKAKYIPNKSIVTGPFYFVIEDIPLYFLGLPFGYFPQRKYNSSGIVQPSFYREQARGIGLRGLGYYFVINDYMDLKITADIFSKGSWGISVFSKYKKRYKYNGSLNFNYSHIATGEPYLEGSEVKNNFSIYFTFNQDAKANPTSRFSITLNLDKGNNRQYNTMDIMQFVNNTTRSSISFQKHFRGTPFVFSVTGGISQNLTRGTIVGNLPTIQFNMNRITPFKKMGHNPRAWYKDLNFSFTSQFLNRFSTVDSIFFDYPELLPQFMQSAIIYRFPFSTSFTVFRYFRISPSINYTGRVYFRKLKKYWTTDTAGRPYIEVDTIYEPFHLVDFNAGVSASTTLYGFFNINAFGIKAIRHKITPSISYSYSPDFSDPKWGYYVPDPEDTTGQKLYYLALDHLLVGYPSPYKREALGININNRFDMKIINRKDSLKKEKKITLIDNLSISGNYNFAVDSLNWSPITIGASTRIGRSSIRLTSTFDPYTLDINGKRINTYEFQVSGKLLRLVNMRVTTNFSISSQDFKKKKQKKQGGKPTPPRKKEYVPYHYFDPEWQIRANYSLTLSRRYDELTQSYTKISIRQVLNLNFYIKPTPYWQFSVITGYDFTQMRLTPTSFMIYRDLHCWQMSINVIPFGRMRSYMFSIKVKSPLFSFLEFKRQRSWHDNAYTY